MNNNQTLKNKIVALGKLGFWMTAVTILISFLFHTAYQYSLWSGNWSWFYSREGFTAEDLKVSTTRGIVSAVGLSGFLFNVAISFVVLFLFRAMWRGRAISGRTAGLATILGIFCVLGILNISIEAIPLEERWDASTPGMISITITNFRNLVFGILAFAIGGVIRFANEQERQLEEIV